MASTLLAALVESGGEGLGLWREPRTVLVKSPREIHRNRQTFEVGVESVFCSEKSLERLRSDALPLMSALSSNWPLFSNKLLCLLPVATRLQFCSVPSGLASIPSLPQVDIEVCRKPRWRLGKSPEFLLLFGIPNLGWFCFICVLNSTVKVNQSPD